MSNSQPIHLPPDHPRLLYRTNIAKAIINMPEVMTILWSKDPTILDNQCSYGHMGAALVVNTKDPVYIASVDPSREAIRQAVILTSTMLRRPNWKHEIIPVDEPLPFPDNMFSLAITIRGLDYFDESILNMQEVYRTLKPGCYAIFVIPPKHFTFTDTDGKVKPSYLARYDSPADLCNTAKLAEYATERVVANTGFRNSITPGDDIARIQELDCETKIAALTAEEVCKAIAMWDGETHHLQKSGAMEQPLLEAARELFKNYGDTNDEMPSGAPGATVRNNVVAISFRKEG